MRPELIAFDRLLNIMDDLREKCPWDKKQTMDSLRYLTIEETYELADAIIEGDLQEVKGELGDLFLHLVFYSKIGSEKGAFDVTDVLNNVCEKLIRRHPHIYGDVNAEDEETVKANWEKIKLEEKKIKGSQELNSVLAGVPKSLPALVKSIRIQEKVKGVGFDWDNKNQVWEKVNEEIAELKVEEDLSSDKIEDEFGDVLFALINYSRFLDVNPEQALEKTNKKFIRRFQMMESFIQKDEKDIAEMPLKELDTYWELAKKEINKQNS